jgi:hypothetical protein
MVRALFANSVGSNRMASRDMRGDGSAASVRE